MKKIRRFLGIFVSLFIIAIAGNVHAAGYTCDSIKQYTACNAGYYPSECGTKRDGSAVTTQPGGKCLSCPANYTCTGVNLNCPLPAIYTITLNATQNGGTGGTGTVYEKYATGWSLTNFGTTVTSITRPTKTNNVFNGYYTAASGGTQKIPASGALPANTTFTADTILYAQYSACNACTKGTGVASCSLSVTNNACTYSATCSSGYITPTCTSAGACSCTPGTYTITLNDNNGSGGTGTAKEVYATK
ncbi:MAG: InlB B-repeat-containing protein, partial [Alphaproteobacteria bacterium]|nr:InlB B-repeat-containing protein [Alphaproteobacteria bacterium]